LMTLANASIEFRTNDGTNNNQGALTVDPNGRMALVADWPTSEVSVPNINTDILGVKNNSFIELTADLVQVPTLTIAGDTISSINSYATAAAATTISSGQVSVSSIVILGQPNSTITIGTASTSNAIGAPRGRLLISGTDLDLGQNDLYAQQVRLGFGNPGGSAQPELIFYPPDGTNPKQLNVAGSDATLRITSTINSGTGGYLLDTFLNPPLFSTINNSLGLVARFPAPTTGSAGYSTISLSQNYIWSGYDSTTQTVVGANTITPLQFNSQVANVGGFTQLGSTITVPVAGIYSIDTSIQFATPSGGNNNAFWWLMKNGSNVPQTATRVVIANNADTVGTTIFTDTAAAGDKYSICIESPDTGMAATAVVATGNIPAIPSVIANIRKIG
jgi:hypothetical protein